ncbi:MAG: threonine synthase [Deltaproteobacteria bacterium]|nr:threonine synthase [Deltaproteobacteria bacterium]
MRYVSTRGKVDSMPFKDAVMMGLANDGGLLLPEFFPVFSLGEIKDLAKLSYTDLAFKIMSLYCEGLPRQQLKEIIDRSYRTFSHPEITPIVKKDELFILELFHGPTLAFKDLALQFLGNLFEDLVKERRAKMNILGATSGDTGSAAIYGLKNKNGINIFILHPKGKVSPIQKLQMTTVTDPNVFNLAIRGTFDDGQSIVKQVFNDLEFKARHSLASINSINWARLLAQTVYYFYAWGKVYHETSAEEVCFSVPTGNFGDIFAGYIAKQMGLPICQLVIATNENNILTRFVLQGDYSLDTVRETYSPSMDIQVASNFERYLYFVYDQNPEKVRNAMDQLKEKQSISFNPKEIEKISQDFTSVSVNQDETLATIRTFYQKTGYILDPHTAVGIKAGQAAVPQDVPLICLATAHPAKFSQAVNLAIGKDPEKPPCLQGIEKKEERCVEIDAQTEAIKAFVSEHAL